MLRLLIFTSVLHQILATNFTCLNGDTVGADDICNGVANCADQSDERVELCATTICQPNQFKCYYGGCVDREKVCNKFTDCLDNSDEFNCGRSNNSCGYVVYFFFYLVVKLTECFPS